MDFLEKIQVEKTKLVKENKINIKNNEEFAYWLGQIIYYLVKNSQAKVENQIKLLQPIVNCRNYAALDKTVKEKYLDKYYHKLSLAGNFRNELITKTLNYLVNIPKSNPLNEEKLYFYIGFFDNNNIFYEKKGDINE